MEFATFLYLFISFLKEYKMSQYLLIRTDAKGDWCFLFLKFLGFTALVTVSYFFGIFWKKSDKFEKYEK